MYQRDTINLGNLLLSLSDAMDLANPALNQHQLRTGFIALEVARQVGLADPDVERIYGAALLHDIGALSPLEKVRLLKFEESDTESHCRRGELLLDSVSQLRRCAPIVRHHHTPWSRWTEVINTPVVLGSQILYLADQVERMVERDVFVLHQDKAVRRSVRRLARTEIHPDVVDAFMEVSRREEFWLDLSSPRLYSLLLHHGPYRRLELEIADLGSLAELFCSVVDFRSRFTATHSAGVARCAAHLAGLFGFTRTECSLMEVAGNLHDLGKLVIPIEVLDKPGDLTEAETALFRQHTYFTYSVLDTIGGMKVIAEWAAFHHERLDGSGYPFHRTAEELDTGARMLAVADVFTAIVEDRPYRPGLGQDQVTALMRHLAKKRALDGRLVELLLDNYDAVFRNVKHRQESVRQRYEQEYASIGAAGPVTLMASGL